MRSFVRKYDAYDEVLCLPIKVILPGSEFASKLISVIVIMITIVNVIMIMIMIMIMSTKLRGTSRP